MATPLSPPLLLLSVTSQPAGKRDHASSVIEPGPCLTALPLPGGVFDAFDLHCRGAALLSRVAVDTLDPSTGMRIIRPLRNIMRAECVSVLTELCTLPQAAASHAALSEIAAAEGAASSIGDLMKAFVALLQVPNVRRQSRVIA